MSRRWRLAYLVSHPIQYQAPLLRRIAGDPDIDLTVFYCSDRSLREYADEGFGRTVKWDVPLIGGYKHEFLGSVGDTDRPTFIRPFNFGIARRLREGRFHALWIHGWGHLSHWWAVRAARRADVKVLMRGESGTHLRASTGFRGALKNALLGGLMARVDGFLAIGSLNRQYYIDHRVDPARIFLMPYAVDNGFFQARAQQAAQGREHLRQSLQIEPDRPVILFAGKLIPRKRPFELLEAYASLSPDGKSEPRPYLLFVGDGPLLPELENRVRALGWSSIRLPGFKNQTDLPAYYDLCDVFAITSEQEPWGLVVNEVMNAGRAVIASDEVGSAHDLIRHGENGYVYGAGDTASLARYLRILTDEPSTLVRMGQNSLERIERWDFESDVAGLKQALLAVATRQ